MRAFKDRQEAGRLAQQFVALGYGGRADVYVFGLPRGLKGSTLRRRLD
ncbi:MAG TPA: hypothetical protein VFS50_04945 [Meiothermus sp.]|jgi:predicted phosphoribosyltransferase|nr:hypothetical protein [Meiothermus sp.]